MAIYEDVEPVNPAIVPKPGMRAEVASKLGCSGARVSAAIKQLIAEGKRNAQRQGVVYDSEGNVLAVDPERIHNPTGSFTTNLA